jgi:GNAT superfamily N-acetyltransferase
LTGAPSRAFRLERVPFEHPDAVTLRDEHVTLGNQLYADDPAAVHRGGSEGIDPASIVATYVAYDGDRPVGHACLRRLDGAMAGEVEMKRLYVREDSRGSGVADDLLVAIEQAALTFYGRRGYTPIPVFAPYEAVTYSLCFEKTF